MTLQEKEENLLAAKAANDPNWIIEATNELQLAQEAEAARFSEIARNPEVQRIISELDELAAMIKRDGVNDEMERIQRDLKQDLSSRFGYDWTEKLAQGGQVKTTEEEDDDYFPLF